MRYAIVIEKTEAGTYSAYPPDLPGVAANGATPDEVRQNLREAIKFHLEGLAADNLPTPQPEAEIEYLETSAT